VPDICLQAWDVDGNLLHILKAHTGGIRALAIAPGGRLVSGSRDTTLRVWSRDGRLLHTLRGHTDWVSVH